MSLSPVPPSKTVDRILGIPERSYTDEQADSLARVITAALRTPLGLMTLFRHQAIALYELRKYGVCFGGRLQVGSGKTLISALAPTAVGSTRSLLLVPGDLVEKTRRDFDKLAVHWKFTAPRVMSYEYLSLEQGGQDLEKMAPDLIIADEAHKLKNAQKAGRVKKLRRYLEAKPGTKFVVLTGTAQGKEIAHFAHLLYWSLRAMAPVPCPIDGAGWKADLLAWGEALDPHKGSRPPGDIMRIERPEEADRATPMHSRARVAIARKLGRTYGVVESYDLDVQASINIHFHTDKCPASMAAHWLNLRKKWERPDGFQMVDSMEVWRCAQQFTHGFFYRWTETAPDDWKSARKSWAGKLRAVLDTSRRLDTPAQVQRLAQQEQWPEWQAWSEVRDSFVPETEAIWVDDFIFPQIKKWCKKGGVVFISHRAVGERIPDIGLKYFGDGGLSADGELIDDCKDFAVAGSAKSCTVGHNLQHNFNRALVLQPQSGGEWNEQMVGRFHRPGLLADEVNIHMRVACSEQRNSLRKLFPETKYIADLELREPKIFRATKIGLQEVWGFSPGTPDWQNKEK